MYNKYQLKKNFWSSKSKYVITDEMDNVRYVAKRPFLSWKKVADLYDNYNNYILSIRHKPFSWRSTYFIDINGVESYRFVKSFRLKDQIFVDSLTEADAFTIEGNFWSNEYKFIQQNCEFAYVSKKMWSVRDSYGIAVEETYDPSLIISCVIMIDHIKERQRAAAG